QREQPLSLMTGPVISSADGKYLFYFKSDDTGSAGQPPTDGPIHLMRRDLRTNDEKELYRAESSNGYVPFLTASPDGRNLAFTYGQQGKGSWTNWVFPLSGGEPRALPSLEGSSGSWTPDGKALLFVRSDEIWVQPIDGGPSYD